MNDKNETRTMYPLKSINSLWWLQFFIVSPRIESEDQLDGLLKELHPALDKWIEVSCIDDKNMVALLYHRSGNPHKRSVCTHIIDTGSEYPYYSFQRIVQRLAEPPNVIFDEAELISSAELERRDWMGFLEVVIMPLDVWDALPSTCLEDESLTGNYVWGMPYVGIEWLKAQDLPIGWHLFFEAFHLGFWRPG